MEDLADGVHVDMLSEDVLTFALDRLNIIPISKL